MGVVSRAFAELGWRHGLLAQGNREVESDTKETRQGDGTGGNAAREGGRDVCGGRGARSARSSRRCLFMNKGKFGVRSPKSTFAVLQRPTIERPVDGSWRVLFRCWWSTTPTCPGRSVKIRIGKKCVHEHRRWPSGVFMNNAPLGRSIFLTDRPNDQGMRR